MDSHEPGTCFEEEDKVFMKLVLVRHLWGVDLSGGFTPHLPRWHSAGYTVLETSQRTVPDPAELRHVLTGEGFRWIPQVFSNMFQGHASVAVHLQSLREQIEETLDANPLIINAHSGFDSWTLDEAEEFYHQAAALERELGCVLTHETHRSRFFGHPWQTRRLLERVPGLKLTCDFSHWVCVAERLLQDAEDIIELAAEHAFHLHCRVGHEQGPQVSDPRAPEWAAHLQTHERWWHKVWQSQRRRGLQQTTMTPEFGPAPYLPLLPYTLQPVIDLPAVCDWIADRETKHFEASMAHSADLDATGKRMISLHARPMRKR